jgi:hypothetical protein
MMSLDFSVSRFEISIIDSVFERRHWALIYHNVYQSHRLRFTRETNEIELTSYKLVPLPPEGARG